MRERGFTLVEMIIILCIIAVLLPIGLISMRTSRDNGKTMSAVAVAQVYADGIDRFAREHSGRYPQPPGSADWSGSTGSTCKKGAPTIACGPMSDVLGDLKFYVRKVPETIQDRSVLIGSTSPSLPSLSYQVDANAASYAIVVTVPHLAPCAIRSGPTSLTTYKECSLR